MVLRFETTNKNDSRFDELDAAALLAANGFCWQKICYAILWGGLYYGHIVGGSANKALAGTPRVFRDRWGSSERDH